MRLIPFITLTIVLLAAAAEAAERSPVGKWRWFTNVTVTLKEDGTATATKGNRGIWKWTDMEAGELKIIWVRTADTLKLSEDGDHLRGHANNGAAVYGARIDPTAPLGTPAVNIPREFLGVWTIFYDNDHVRTYSISAAGTVTWTHTHGQPGPNKKAKILQRNEDFLIDFRDEDKIERVSVGRRGLHIEHFNPKSNYRDGKAPIEATGTKKK